MRTAGTPTNCQEWGPHPLVSPCVERVVCSCSRACPVAAPYKSMEEKENAEYTQINGCPLI